MGENESLIDNGKVVYGVIVVISVIGLVAGYYLEAPEHAAGAGGGLHYWQKVLAHLCTEVGIAGLIVLGLATTIERFAAKESELLTSRQRESIREESKKLATEERQQAKEDVFHYVFARLIPKEITDEIDTQLLKADFVRDKVIMYYTLRPVVVQETQAKYILLELEMTYDVRNLTTREQSFTINSSIELSPTPALAGESKFTRVTASNCPNPFTLEGDKIKTRREEVQLVLDLDERVRIPGRSSALVTVRSQTIKHYEGGSDFYRLGSHTCKLDLTVQVIGDAPLAVYAGTFSPEIKPEPTMRHRPENNYYNWEVKKPLLAFQGIYISWMPAATPVAASPSAQPAAEHAPGGREVQKPESEGVTATAENRG